MFNVERNNKILAYMRKHDTASIQKLSDCVYASPSTIRRSLNELENQGFLKRVHGGAVLTLGSTFDTPASIRKAQRLEEKKEIAALANKFLKPSASYFFDSSSTASILAWNLTNYPNVKLATNGLEILFKICSNDNLAIIALGGYLRSPWGEFTGNITINNIENMNADIFFFSCAGFTLQEGAMEFSDENVAVKKAFLKKSKLHILLCDHTKFGQTSFLNSIKIQDIDYIVTDQRPSNDYVEALQGKIIF